MTSQTEIPQDVARELLRAAKEARAAQKEYMLNDTYKNRLMMRACEDALDAAITKATQDTGKKGNSDVPAI